MRQFIVLLIILMLNTVNMTYAQSDAKIDWEVVNRFPLFKEDSRFARLVGMRGMAEQASNNAIWAPGMSAEAVMTSEKFYKRLREHLPPSNQTAWKAAEGLYDQSQIFRRNNAIVASTELKDGQCEWEIWQTDTDTQISRTLGSCNLSPLLEVPDIAERFDLRLKQVNGRLLGSAKIAIKQELVVALGDSFASGEGNPDHPATFQNNVDRGLIHDWFIAHDNPAVIAENSQAAWWDRACHRSLLSWPAMAAFKKAVSEPHTVVQFASFACSGAEIYDGFLTPQLEPPGYEYSTAVEKVYIRSEPLHPADKPKGEYRHRLRYSQLQALAHLLCQGKVTNQPAFHKRTTEIAVRGNQRPFFGVFERPKCSGNLRQVSRVFLMFGGNDTGFSRVVLQAVDPRNLEFRIKWAGSFINSGIAQELNPVLPEDAYRRGILWLPELLRHVNLELVQLRVNPSDVTLAAYPDLIQDLTRRSAQALKRCNQRTADGFAPLQVLLGERAGHDGARFGLRTQNLKLIESIRDIYIGNLIKAQQQSADSFGWRVLGTTSAFMGRDICAVAHDCSGDNCPNGDRVRWAWSHVDRALTQWDESYCLCMRDKPPARHKECQPSTFEIKPEGGPPSQTIHYCGTAPIRKLSEFNPYDPSRLAGVRFATDALLATANRERQASHGAMHNRRFFFSQDGIYGLAHPTAHMHSRIADMVQW